MVLAQTLSSSRGGSPAVSWSLAVCAVFSKGGVKGLPMSWQRQVGVGNTDPSSFGCLRTMVRYWLQGTCMEVKLSGHTAA